MDAFNENLNEQQAQQPMGCLHRFSKTIKVVIIGLSITKFNEMVMPANE